MDKVGENARRAAVISSPDLGVFAVTAAGPEPRRGHVICSGVFAVAAVTAADVPAWSTSWLARRVPGRPELADQLYVGGCAAGQRMVLRSSRASQVTVVVRIIRAPRWAGLRGQPGGVVAAAAPATPRALKCLATGSVPSRAGITACGREPLYPRPGRPRARPSAGAPRPVGARRTGMTPVMPTPRSCGGDMSSPQKCPSTRHYLRTTSDNRR
jgi:hypothetical protein